MTTTTEERDGERPAKMISELDEIELLQLQMKDVRTHLDEEVDDLVQSAHAAVDWRRQWRHHPWIGCAAAMAVGYAIVPARRCVPAESRLLTDAQVAVASTALSPTRRLIAELAGMVLGLAAERGIRFAARQIEQSLADRLRHAEKPRIDNGVPANGHEQHLDRRCDSPETDSASGAHEFPVAE